MPRLDGTGPKNKGQKTGRGLGVCKTEEPQNLNLLGKGLATRNKSGGGKGMGKRLQSGIK